MAINILSANLNAWGNAGNFETDKSSWGFSNSNAILSRSSAQAHKDTYSAEVKCFFAGPYTRFEVVRGRFLAKDTKKYLAQAWIYVPTATPIAPDAYEVRINTINTLANSPSAYLEITAGQVVQTIADLKGVWLQIETYFTAHIDTGIYPPTGTNLPILIHINPAGSGNYLDSLITGGAGPDIDPIVDGLLYADEFEVFEYEEIPDTCTLELDIDNFVIVNATGPFVSNGSVQLATTGGVGTLEYSKDAGASWQSSPLFAGLTPGATYEFRAREVDTPACQDSTILVINFDGALFDWTFDVVNESVLGANDGTITITPSGAGAPFTYSKDGGTIYQAGNLFAGLAPATYPVLVKDTSGNVVAKYITVAPGSIQYASIVHSKNPITLDKFAAAGWDALVNYRLYNDIRVEDQYDSGVYNSKLKVDLTPDSTGKVTFYLAEAFRDAFTFNLPNRSGSAIVKLTDRIRRFKSFTGELQNTEVTPGALTESLLGLVVYGGIDKFHFPGLNYFANYLPANKKFLTWAPLVKLVDKLQEDYLNFFIYATAINVISVKVKGYYDDATTNTITWAGGSGINYGELYQIQVGPYHLFAPLSLPDKNLLKYDVWIENQVTLEVISEVRTYVIAPFHPRARFFMFLNSLGAFEVLRFTGVASKKTEFSKQVVKKYLPANYAATDGEFEINSAVMTELANYSSGFVDKQWQEYLKDLLLSRRVYEVTSGLRLPVTVLSGDHNTEDQNYLRYIRFEARPAYDNTSFTPEVI